MRARSCRSGCDWSRRRAACKVILVTGASSGIGEATARLLASEGHHVILGARRIERLTALVSAIRAEGGSAQCCALDVTRLAEVRDFVALAQKAHGRVDVMISNAGVMPLSKLEALLKWRNGTA